MLSSSIMHFECVKFCKLMIRLPMYCRPVCNMVDSQQLQCMGTLQLALAKYAHKLRLCHDAGCSCLSEATSLQMKNLSCNAIKTNLFRSPQATLVCSNSLKSPSLLTLAVIGNRIYLANSNCTKPAILTTFVPFFGCNHT